ncbi:helix-turn-helix domain-containing protein [Rhabdothermincola sediminis]|uniref:helix-turn-helix domain-containing protein n=1 Tax=Rhabdothermincola sediminis TaxID=2751370 RepID=UPI001AA044A4|nr:helix-turn-helix domain-containing protein [Rhabdothermincola sediminis]
MDVVLLRWPLERERRAHLEREGRPRLLLLDDGVAPPAPVDCLEDWVRVPAAAEDLRSRVDALAQRFRAHHRASPTLDGDGVLRCGEQWVLLPPVEARLVGALLERMGAVVSREQLSRVGWPGGSPGRNALDVHVLRSRRRIAPLGLAIRTVRSRGYLLELGPGVTAAGGEDGSTASDPCQETVRNA